MKAAKFEDLFLEGLESLYDAEKQIVAALPKIIAASSSGELATAFQRHLDESREHLVRLERLFTEIGAEPGVREAVGMQGLIQEGQRLMDEIQKSPVLDAALIGAAQKVKHYEIAAYGTARAMAEMLGQAEVADTLLETLDEETAADGLLAEIADSIINGEAISEDEGEAGEGEEIPEGA